MQLRRLAFGALFSLGACGPDNSSRDVAEASADAPAAEVLFDAGPDSSLDASDGGAMDALSEQVLDASAEATADASPPWEAGAGRLYVASLQGVQEVPPRYAELMDGRANLTLSTDRSTLFFDVTHPYPESVEVVLLTGLAGGPGTMLASLGVGASPLRGQVAASPQLAAALEGGLLSVQVRGGSVSGGRLRGQALLPGETLYVASLTGAQHAPARSTTQSAQAQWVLSPDASSVRFVVSSSFAPTALGLFQGAGGRSGTMVSSLPTSMTGAAGVTTVNPTSTMADLPTAHQYLELSDAANPDGLLRGQLLHPGDVLYVAELLGSNEVPPVTTSGSGSIAMVLTASRITLVYDGLVSGVTLRAAQLRRGPAGMDGTLESDLRTFANTMTGTMSIGFSLPPVLDMGGAFVNVSTTAVATGELRGQLARR